MALASGSLPQYSWPPRQTSFQTNNKLKRDLLLLLLLIAGIHPHPGPSSPPPSRPLPPPRPTLLQWNCNGIQGKVDDLRDFLYFHRISIAALQETKLLDTSRLPSIPGYTLVNKNRGGGGGGVAFLIHHSIPFTPIDVNFCTDAHIELQGIKLRLNQSDVSVFNVYIPPSSSCQPQYQPDIISIFDRADDDSFILGDLNAHHSAWGSTITDARGRRIAAALANSSLVALNSGSSTRRPFAANQPSTSPDVSIASPHLALPATWEVLSSLSSDHLPITISLPNDDDDDSPPNSPTCYTNFRRADIPKFKRLTEEGFSGVALPKTAAQGVATFQRILTKASKWSIPAGKRRVMVPGESRTVRDLREERDEIRAADPVSPEVERLTGEINSRFWEEKRQRWRAHVKSCDRRAAPQKHWRLLRGLEGKSAKAAPNQPVEFEGKFYSSPKDIANKFMRQYAFPPSSDKVFRRVKRRLDKHIPLDRSFSPFSVDDTANAIKSSKNSTATGPDGLAPWHLKHLGAQGLQYLTATFNLSVATAEVPSIWKSALVIPIPKPGKPIGKGPSYRPVSLLCPAVKVLERLLLPSLKEHLVPASHQHGFRQFHSTTSALLPLVTKVADGMKQPKPPRRSAVVAVDLSQAFDRVPIPLLLDEISQTTLHPNIIRWLRSYLQGRQAACVFQGHRSAFRRIHLGVPQGSVISPVLFNFYVRDFPRCAELTVS